MGNWASLVVVLGLALVIASCSDDSGPKMGPPLESTSPIVGDWFLCDAADCSTLKNHGVTWAADGRWVLLLVRDAQALSPTGKYCASRHDADRGPFTFDETTGVVVMMDDLGRDAGGGVLAFAPSTVTLSNGRTSSLYSKIDPSRSIGDCPVN
jgi:hypothetical protein